jgi:NADPH:quinone reductase-like Zn-dependent oxidoreductase
LIERVFHDKGSSVGTILLRIIRRRSNHRKVIAVRVHIVEEPNGDFREVDLARPASTTNQVLVRIAASGVNPLDTKIRAGKATHAKQPLPAILGLDMAGTIEEVGSDVARFRPGDEVYGMVGGVGGLQGTLAEFIAADADLIARKPSNLTMRLAAALPLSIITAWEGLVDRANVSAGQRTHPRRRRW